MTPWKRLIRFIALEDGLTYQGEPIAEAGLDIGKAWAGLKAKVITGDVLKGAQVTEEQKTVKTLLAPFATEQAGLVRCVGLNYVKHIKEGHIGKIPDWPTLFIKPRTSLAGPGSETIIPKIAQDNSMDYEAELCFVVGKTGKDIKKENALEHVLGFTVGNDVSWRRAQQQFPYSGSQWCYGKGLDGFAPIGPVLVSPQALDTSDLLVQLRLNGDVMQDGRTSEMMHTVQDIIAHFSQGTTLEAGTVVMTGTPQGVGYARATPVYLKDGDKIEVEIQGIGSLQHSIKYE
ncbi:degradation of aromatic compounds [Meredithblackwellia eburnea MCA 4105]